MIEHGIQLIIEPIFLDYYISINNVLEMSWDEKRDWLSISRVLLPVSRPYWFLMRAKARHPGIFITPVKRGHVGQLEAGRERRRTHAWQRWFSSSLPGAIEVSVSSTQLKGETSPAQLFSMCSWHRRPLLHNIDFPVQPQLRIWLCLWLKYWFPCK